MFALWRQRALSNILQFGLALLVGVIIAQVCAMVAIASDAPNWCITASTVIGDNVGFYGILLWFEIRAVGSCGKAVFELTKKYWLSELLDSMQRTAWLTLAASTPFDPAISAFLGNMAANVCFFAFFVVAGIELSDLMIKGVKRMIRL